MFDIIGGLFWLAGTLLACVAALIIFALLIIIAGVILVPVLFMIIGAYLVELQ